MGSIENKEKIKLLPSDVVILSLNIKNMATHLAFYENETVKK